MSHTPRALLESRDMTSSQESGKSHIISPTAQRVLSLTSPSTLLLVTDGENDDAEEIRKRRRSVMLEKQQTNVNSPIKTADRRKSLASTAVWSNVQIAEHYASCIKLSTENKITSKNAFGLHLIDYMTEQLKKNELNDFQVASSTLDASAKIYAGRVDAIHSETYKVLSGLGRGSDQKPDEGIDVLDPDNPDDEDNLSQKARQARKKRDKKRKTIETNLKNITLPKLDAAFQVDPLFQKMSAAFDSAGTNGLLISQLHTLDDCTVVFDGTTQVNLQTNNHRSNARIEATQLKSHISETDITHLAICPEFNDFEFTNWTSDDQSRRHSISSSHAFDIDQAPEHEVPLDAPPEQFPGVIDGHDDFIMAEDDINDNESVCTANSSILGDGQETQIVDNVIESIRHSTNMGSLMSVLSTEPSEFSYFKTNLLKTWAGPAHWKVGMRAREALKATQTKGKKRSTKKAFEIVFHDKKDFESFFKVTKKSTTLTKKTAVKHSKTSRKHPEELKYKADQLFQLFGIPSVMIKKTDEKQGADLEKAIDDYDYNNRNDRENFCPVIENDDGADDYEDNAFDDPIIPSQDDFKDGSQTDHAINQTVYTEDNMVSQPWKADIINIGYAKTAKRVDVKRLKAAMWNILKTLPKDSVTDDDATDKVGEAVNGCHSFQSLINDMPAMLPQTMVQNLSVPIMFNCILHLANEKILDIKNVDQQNDLLITQG